MRSRKSIEKDSKNVHAELDILMLEVLLDVRDSLSKQISKRKSKKKEETCP